MTRSGLGRVVDRVRTLAGTFAAVAGNLTWIAVALGVAGGMFML